MSNAFVAMVEDEAGATLVEYSLIVGLIAIVCIGAVTLLGGKVTNSLSNSGNNL